MIFLISALHGNFILSMSWFEDNPMGGYEEYSKTVMDDLQVLRVAFEGEDVPCINTICERIEAKKDASEYKSFLLYYAVCNDYLEIAALLLERGAQAGIVGFSRGKTALHSASKKGSLEMVKLLLKWGADVKAGR